MKISMILVFTATVMFSHAQKWSPGSNMKNALVTTLAKTVAIEKNSKTLGWEADQPSIMGAFLAVSEEVRFSTTLTYGKEYVFIGIGTSSVEDLDITVIAPNGTEYKDVLTDNEPVVKFTAYQTGKYSIRLKHYKGTKSSFCSVAVLRSGGYAVDVTRIDDALDEIIAFGENIYKLNGDTYFLDKDNQWCFYGGYMTKGSSLSISNIDLGYNNCYIISTGDSYSTDIDLCLKRNDLQLKCDTDTDNHPYIRWQGAGSGYEVSAKNYSSSTEKVFMMFCILTD